MNTDTTIVKAIIAFTHPIIMLGTLVGAFYASYLGMQARRSRTASKDIKTELLKGRFKQRHFQLSSLLLPLWIIGGLGGMVATYTLYQKLFVSPHLILGLTAIAVVAVAAALVPLMQQGHEWARLTHITLTITVIGLTVGQTVTGFQIVQKLFDQLSGIS